jgi:hypothetical protein
LTAKKHSLKPAMREMQGGDMKIKEILLENILSKFPGIGLDIDETLIGDNPKKEELWDFIVQNQGKHVFNIITFRVGASFQHLWDDLHDGSNGILKKEYFKQAFTPGRELYLSYLKYTQIQKIKNKNKALRIIKNEGLDWNNILQNVAEMLQYKGKTCWLTGCKVLVDDDEHRVIQGCKKYKITYLHPSQV